MKMNKKHKIILIVIGILIITSITIGISYAYWQLTHKQTESNELATGCLEVTFEETGSDIVLTNTFPIIDEEGLQQVPYSFKIKNTCTIDAQYNITLNSFGTTNLMADSSIKYAFGLSNKNNSTYDKKILTAATENTDISNIDLNNLIKSYIIGSGFLRVGEEKEFSLYLWMDQDAPMSEMNKTFSSKIYITNVTTNKAPLLANLATTTSISATGKFLNGPLVKNTIEKLEFVNSNKVPTDAISSWDVSEQQNGAIMAWYYDNDSNGLYEVYIGQEEGVIANSDSSYLFQNLTYLSSINLANLDTSNVTNMYRMFYSTGYSSTLFTLDLGNKFDTSNVTNMSYMFYETGYSSTVFTLDLGSLYDTYKVTNMGSMFRNTGYSSTVFTLDLGSKFDTSKVTDMSYMFASTGSSSTVFTLDLGSKFDTSNVTGMSSMFSMAGYSNTVFTLNLGDKFNTSNVTNMSNMFSLTGRNSTVFTLDLGSKFDTSKVTGMWNMFYNTGYSSPIFTLNLGENFNTSKVTGMWDMFYNTGYSSLVFTLNLGDKFDTSNVTNMGSMFRNTGYSSTVFTLDLGSKFDTSNVTNMGSMFNSAGYNSPIFTLNLGDKFNTLNVGDMSSAFHSVGYSNPDFMLNLKTFDFYNVYSFTNIFYNSKTTHTAYVKNASDATLVKNKGFAGTVIDCSSNTCP